MEKEPNTEKQLSSGGEQQSQALPTIPANTNWDYEVQMPTTWYIRGKNPTMRLIAQEQVEALTSSGNPWPLALFTLAGGIAASLYIQLKAGVVDLSSRPLLWGIFYPMLILTTAFGIFAIRDYFKTKRTKHDVVEDLPSVQAAAPTIPVRRVNTDIRGA
jgi:hypothetical protein